MPTARQLQYADRLASRNKLEVAIAVAYMALAMLLGGGGSSAPLSELLLELVAAIAAAGWLFAGSRRETVSQPQDRLVWVITALALALPVLQLLPLPPAIWQALPNRENEIAALKLVGADSSWMPWSMTPSLTFASLLSIVPAVLAMIMVASLDHRARSLVIATIAAVSFASLVLGALQLSAGNSNAWRPYGAENGGYLFGFQANRNGAADILLFGIVAFAAVIARYRQSLGEGLASTSVAFGTILLGLGCLATGSRTGVALLPVCGIAVAIIWIRRRPGLRGTLLGGAIAVAIGIGAVLLLYRHNNRAAHVIDRFVFSHDPRENIWADTVFAISQYWPFGTGIGSFKPIFIANERLEFVDIFYPTSAHNDYLELALEGGLIGLVLLAAISFFIALMMYRSLLTRSLEGKAQTVFATTALIIIASHSVVDYPLRSMAIACIAGAAVGLLSAVPRDDQGGIPAA